MRSYLHRPDEAFLLGELPKLTRRVGMSEEAIPQKVADGKLNVFDALVDNTFHLVRVQWALDAPVQEVAGTTIRTINRIREALSHGFVVGPMIIDRWLEIALIGGDPGSAGALMRLYDQGIDGLKERGEATQWFLAALRALLGGHRDAASEAAKALGQWLDSPAVPARVATAMTGLDRMIAAAAGNDQRAFDRAVEARRTAWAESFTASDETRRHTDALLDAAGATVARLAGLRGITLPPDDAYLATELLQTLPWRGPVP